MSQYQFAAPKLGKINKIIVVASGGMFLLHSILVAVGAFSLVNILGLSSSGFFSGYIFQLVTYPLIETQLMPFLFNTLIIWFLGTELETNWGPRVYIRFLFITIISVGLVFSLVNFSFFHGTYIYQMPLHGLSGINFSLLVAYAILYPDRQMSLMMIFPMRARTFCWILAGIEAYMAIFSSLAASWAHLLAMGVSYLIIHFQNKPIVSKVLNSSWTIKKQGKSSLYLVKDDNHKPPKFWQ